MDIWYAQETIQVVMTLYKYKTETFFDSQEAMQKYIDEYEPDTLHYISGYGKAVFNSKGILVPGKKGKRK